MQSQKKSRIRSLFGKLLRRGKGQQQHLDRSAPSSDAENSSKLSDPASRSNGSEPGDVQGTSSLESATHDEGLPAHNEVAAPSADRESKAGSHSAEIRGAKQDGHSVAADVDWESLNKSMVQSLHTIIHGVITALIAKVGCSFSSPVLCSVYSLEKSYLYAEQGCRPDSVRIGAMLVHLLPSVN